MMMAAVCVGSLMGQPAFAAEGKRVAFVVGIGTYDHLAPDKQLKNPVNDAEGVSAKLTEIGFQVTRAPNLTRSAFNDKWQNVLDSLTRDDTFVLYFSGHGVQVGGQNYLLPRDIPHIEYGRDEQLKREAISLNELLADLSSGDRPHPQTSVVILDACRDNPLIPPGYKSASTARGLAGLPESDGTFVMYAAASNRTALDRLSPSDNAKYSVFTRTLLPLIGRTDLSIQELSNELKDQVWKLAKSAGREQRPTYYDGVVGRFCLPGCVATSDAGGFRENLTTSVRPALSKELTGKDGAPMVLISAGSFLMGSTKDEVERAIKDCVEGLGQDQQTCEGWYKPELPQHKVQMDAFYFDTYEVTNRRFQQFTRQTGYRTTTEREGSAFAFVEGKGWEDVKGASWVKPEAGPTVFDSNRAEHPVVAVSWDDAQAYCRWAEKRLPTEAEWEYAARAGTTTTYWWGQGNPRSRLVENIADESAKKLLKPIMSGYDDGSVRTAPIGSYEANPWGLYDISGNVREWTADWYGEEYYGKSPVRNPTGPSSGQYRMLRGGSWGDGPVHVRSAARDRDTPTRRDVGVGFRCAQDLK
jgi:formylglycine-generating enzyme required for sulfatase activity